jgi:DNA-binding transcriptional MerR regulator
MKASELAGNLGMSSRQLRRWTNAGLVPYACKTNGGHYYYRDSRELRRWVTERQPGRKKRKATAVLAYQRQYREPVRQPRRIQQSAVLSPFQKFLAGITLLNGKLARCHPLTANQRDEALREFEQILKRLGVQITPLLAR